MDLRSYLLAQKGYQDSLGNRVVFAAEGLDREGTGLEFWLFLDEGLRCGGRTVQIPPRMEEIRQVLLGCGKQELWEMLQADVSAKDMD